MIKQRNDNLTKEEELALGKKVQAMRVLQNKMKKDKEYKITNDEAEILEDGAEAFEMLIGNYYNLARNISRKNHQKTGTRYSVEDLDQDAILALVEAAATYDPDRNCRLGTHAHYGITKKVTSTINYQRLVRMPENKMGDYIKISQAQKAYEDLPIEEKEKYANELEYVYANVDVSQEDVNIILRNMQPQVSLNAPIYDSEVELMDTLVDENASREIEEYGEVDDRILDVLKQLTSYEKDLIAFEYGLFPASMNYKEFKAKYELSDKQIKLEINKVNKKMKKIGSKA